MTRCKHGIIEGQCHICKAGLVGYNGKDRNIYGNIDYLDTIEDEPIKMKSIPVDIEFDEELIIEEMDSRPISGKDSASSNGYAESGEKEDEMTEKKVCSNCKEEKAIDDFAPCKLTKDGREGQCRQCRAKKAKARRLDKLKASGKKIKTRGQKSEVGKQKKLIKKTAEKINTFETDDLVPTTAFEIMKLESENKTAIQEAAKLIIETVKKDLLGAVFQELRTR